MYSQDVTFKTQLLNFAAAAAVGVGIALIYEAFRIIRLISPKNKILNFVCDVLFMSFAATVSFVFTVVINDGVVRGYLLLGEFSGFILYMKTLGRLSGALLRFLRKITAKLFAAVFYLFSLLIGKAKKRAKRGKAVKNSEKN